MSANEEIISFLHECVNKNWELDDDDIQHVLNLDFDYVRKQHVPARP